MLPCGNPISQIPSYNTAVKLPNRTNAFSLGASYSINRPRLTKASFQVISIWLGQRKVSFKISYVIIINMASIWLKGLQIVASYMEGGCPG